MGLFYNATKPTQGQARTVLNKKFINIYTMPKWLCQQSSQRHGEMFYLRRTWPSALWQVVVRRGLASWWRVLSKCRDQCRHQRRPCCLRRSVLTRTPPTTHRHTVTMCDTGWVHVLIRKNINSTFLNMPIRWTIDYHYIEIVFAAQFRGEQVVIDVGELVTNSPNLFTPKQSGKWRLDKPFRQRLY